jgi:hypothetical protein
MRLLLRLAARSERLRSQAVPLGELPIRIPYQENPQIPVLVALERFRLPEVCGNDTWGAGNILDHTGLDDHL